VERKGKKRNILMERIERNKVVEEESELE